MLSLKPLLIKLNNIFTSFNPVQDDGGSKKRKNPPQKKTFEFLVLTLLPNWCKISRPYLCQSQIIELEPRPLLKKVVFLVKSLQN